MIRRKKVHFSGKNMPGTAAVHTRERPDLIFAIKFPSPPESTWVNKWQKPCGDLLYVNVLRHAWVKPGCGL